MARRATSASTGAPALAASGPTGAFTVAWLLTLLVEAPIWTWLLVSVLEVDRRRAVGLAIAVNAVSHPLLWFYLQPTLTDLTGSYLAGVAMGEVAVWLGEALAVRIVIGRDLPALLAVSALANLASILVGVVLWWVR